MFPIGLENESSGEEGPIQKNGTKFTVRSKKLSYTKTFMYESREKERERLTVIEIDRRRIGSHG